jgi:streptogramin lyase
MVKNKSRSFFWGTVFFIACCGLKKVLPNDKAPVNTVHPGQHVIKSAVHGGNVLASLQDKKGNIWFGTTNEGVYRYDGKSLTNFRTGNGLRNDNIFSIVEDNAGDIWFGTALGISRYDGKTFAGIPADPTENNTVTCILADKAGKLWFASDNGVYCFDGKTFTNFLESRGLVNKNGLKLQIVQHMLEDKNGNIWFSTKTEGICRYDGKSIISYKPDNELWFRGLLEDKNGNIWAGTRFRGVYRYDGTTFSKVSLNESIDSYTVLSIIQDRSGNIWFGTEAGDLSKRNNEGGVWIYNGITFKNLSIKDGLTQSCVWCILEDSSGGFWFGTRNGFCRYDGKTITSF